MEKWIKIFKESYSKNRNVELGLKELRNAGASQMESVRVLISELKMPISEADNLVLNSSIWKDNLQNTLKFRDHIFDSLSGDEEE